MPKFSIVMPCYNASGCMRNAIGDILNQSYEDWELILINDASADDTGIIAESYAQANHRITAINNHKNMGPGPTRNAGIQSASGKYILFLDSDDRYEKDLLATVNDEIKKHSPDVVFYSLIEEYEKDGNIEYSYIHSLPDSFLETKDSIGKTIAQLERETMLGYPWNKAYRLDIIKENKLAFPDIVHIEDILFNISVMYHVNSISVLQRPLYHYKNGGTDGVTAKYLPDYLALQKQRITEFIRQQEYFDTCDDFTLNTAAGLYFRSFVSFMERELAHGTTKSAIIESAKKETESVLFNRLKAYVGDGMSAKYIYRPLSKGKVGSTFAKVRFISFVRRTFPGIFSRLKQNR